MKKWILSFSLLALCGCSQRLSRTDAAKQIYSYGLFFRMPLTIQVPTGNIGTGGSRCAFGNSVLPDLMWAQDAGYVTVKHDGPEWIVSLTGAGRSAQYGHAKPDSYDACAESNLTVAHLSKPQITGIVEDDPKAVVYFTYNIIPTPQAASLLRNPSKMSQLALSNFGTLYSTADDPDYLTYSGSASFLKYDDGWRYIHTLSMH